MKKQDGIINKFSITYKPADTSIRIEDQNRDLKTVLSDALSYFHRAIFRIQNGDIEGARADFKMAEYLERNSTDKSSNYPVY